MVQSDRDICCSASPGTGRGKGGGGTGALDIPFTGVRREQIFWDTAASTSQGDVFLQRFSKAEFLREVNCELLKVLLLDRGSREGHVWFSFRLVLNVIRYEGVSWLVL